MIQALFSKYFIYSTTDVNGIITDVSDAFCIVSGYSRDELIGQSHNIIRHPDMPKKIFEEMWKAITQGNNWQGELKNKKKDGGYFWVDCVIEPILGLDGDILGYKAVRFDITSKKELEAAMIDLRTSLKAKLPNKAHVEIAKLTCKYPNDISVITQNIDDLFEKADCKNLIHLHGFLPELYCEHCGEMVAIEYQKQYDAYDVCPNCNKDKLRPNIVFFHEQAPMYKNLYEQMKDCEVFVVIGTSGNVINTDMFLNPKIKLSVLNNLEHSNSINDELYTKAIFKPATQAIDEIINMIEKFLNKAHNQ